MLVQLLRKHGIGAQLVPHTMTTRTGVTALDPTGVAMICLCYLEVVGTPSHVRFALRRLRQRAPDAILVAGLWAPDDPVPQDSARRATLGADICAVTLTDVVEVCLREAQAGSETGESADASDPAPRAIPA
jgi:hypothetical protein